MWFMLLVCLLWLASATSNIIQNLVSGLIVLGDKAFEVGDVIQVRVGGKEYRGRVVKIGIRCAVIGLRMVILCLFRTLCLSLHRW